MSEQELNKRLAEWAGINLSGVPNGCDPQFHLSLDACFKWLVPKLWICDITLEEGIFWFVRVAHPNYGEGKANGEAADNKALARILCKAIDKLIKEDKNETQ